MARPDDGGVMFGTYCRLRVSVYASPTAVIRAAYRKIRPSARHGRGARRERHAFYREMLSYHARAQVLAGMVARGRT